MYSFNYYLDSWIEVASQPSSSSLSSITASDEIVTTGLRVPQNRPRRQPIAPQDLDITYSHRPPIVHESSQEEYEETESESDRVLSSSNEDISRRTYQAPQFFPGNSSASDVALSSDEDDNLTALGPANPPAFTPQPNVFSHPPETRNNPQSRTMYNSSGYGPSRMDNRSRSRRNSRASMHSARRIRTQQQSHSPYNMYSPAHHVDHDAALRASLSTLLSCAAAARGLPKRDDQCSPTERSSNPRAAEPSSFRLVPESVAMRDDAEDENKSPREPQYRAATASSPKRSRSPIKSMNKARRKASLSKDRSVTQSPPKKVRRAVTSDPASKISPTVMTWVISAGVVVLFSAISFSAGYVLGREVGRTEAGQGLYGSPMGDGLSGARTSAGCGKSALKGGLKRIRWVASGSGSGIVA